MYVLMFSRYTSAPVDRSLFFPDFMTQAGLMLTVAQILQVVSIKSVYLTAIFLFELGSVLCGAVRSVFLLSCFC